MNMCLVAGELERDGTLSPASKARAFTERVTASGLSRRGRRAFEAQTGAPLAERYEILRAAAREEGLESWRCPALERRDRRDAERARRAAAAREAASP